MRISFQLRWTESCQEKTVEDLWRLRLVMICRAIFGSVLSSAPLLLCIFEGLRTPGGAKSIKNDQKGVVSFITSSPNVGTRAWSSLWCHWPWDGQCMQCCLGRPQTDKYTDSHAKTSDLQETQGSHHHDSGKNPQDRPRWSWVPERESQRLLQFRVDAAWTCARVCRGLLTSGTYQTWDRAWSKPGSKRPKRWERMEKLMHYTETMIGSFGTEWVEMPLRGWGAALNSGSGFWGQGPDALPWRSDLFRQSCFHRLTWHPKIWPNRRLTSGEYLPCLSKSRLFFVWIHKYCKS